MPLPANAGPVEWVGPEHPLYDLSGLVHCVRLPEDAGQHNPVPAVVMLHGWGGDECGMWVFKHLVPTPAAIITPRGPVEFAPGQFGWFDYLDDARRRPNPDTWQSSLSGLRHFLTALPDVYPLDPARLVLMGFSQGAAMLNGLMLTGFRPPAGLVLLAGFVPALAGLAAQAPPLPNLPAFITHGTRDDIVPVEQSRQTRDLYAGLGAAVTYHEYATGHKVHTQGLGQLKGWLNRVL